MTAAMNSTRQTIMTGFLAGFLILVSTACKRAEWHDLEVGDSISMEIINSLGGPAHRVKIVLDSGGKLTRELQSEEGQTKMSETQVGFEDVERVRRIIRTVDWRHISEDKVLGLDGTSVQMICQGATYSIWTPSHDTDQRKLADFLRLETELLRLGRIHEADRSVP
jgi:hypothetical protein